MRKIIRYNLIALHLLLLSQFANAKELGVKELEVKSRLTLHNIISDNMVLQRGKNTRLFGKSEANSTVAIKTNAADRLFEEIKVTADQNGHWSATLPELNATADPFDIIIVSNSQIVKVKNVVIGDIWLASGQSNMHWPLQRSLPKQTEFPYAKSIRIVKSDASIFSDEMQSDFAFDRSFNNSWQEASADYASQCSAVAYFFAVKLNKELNIPIGIVNISRGGTSLRSWTPRFGMEKSGLLDKIVEDYADAKNYFDKRIARFQREGNEKKVKITKLGYQINGLNKLFNAHIAPLKNLAFKGMIWYQGENDSKNAKLYAEVFPMAITSWREFFDNGDFPFYFVQLPGFFGKNLKKDFLFWPHFREAQQKALELPNTGMACVIDSGNRGNVHPPYKLHVGERLALHAIKFEKNDVQARSPRKKEVIFAKNKARVTFTDVGACLKSKKVTLYVDRAASPTETIIVEADKISGFEVCGEDKIFHSAQASFEGKNTVVISSPQVSEIKQIRYGFKSFPKCNLYSSYDLPVVPFRTDNFTIPVNAFK